MDSIATRTRIVGIGRASGLRHIPDPVADTRGHLVKPASGKIEDTRPMDSPGNRQIVREAQAATAEKPLVVCVGGPLTVVADAYLLNHSIADKLVVAWLDNYRDGMYGFNGWRARFGVAKTQFALVTLSCAPTELRNASTLARCSPKSPSAAKQLWKACATSPTGGRFAGFACSITINSTAFSVANRRSQRYARGSRNYTSSSVEPK